MTNFTTNRLYLDQDGLHALIIKIASIYKEMKADAAKSDQADQDTLQEINNLLTKLENIYKGSSTDITALDPNDTGLIKQIVDKITAVEGSVNTLDQREAADKITAIEVDQTTNADKVTVSLTKGDNSKLTADINIADWLAHGMLSDVGVFVMPATAADVTVTTDGSTITIPQATVAAHIVDGASGHKFLAFKFSVAHDGTSTAHDSENKIVILDVESLFTNYSFDAAVNPNSNNYLTFAESDTNSAGNGKQVTYTITLSNRMLRDLALVEGEVAKQTGGTEKFLGIEGLNAAIGNLQAGNISNVEHWIQVHSVTPASIDACFDYWMDASANVDFANDNSIATAKAAQTDAQKLAGPVEVSCPMV